MFWHTLAIAPSLPSALKLGMQTKKKLLPGQPSFGGLGPATSGPHDSSNRHKLYQHTFVDALAVSGAGEWPVPGTLHSTCGPFQLAAEPTELHNSNCNGMLNLCFDDGVSCCVSREVKARKFAVRYGPGPATPALPWCG
eukprot:1148351-Pelagomonas_calceolata.AAC.1